MWGGDVQDLEARAAAARESFRRLYVLLDAMQLLRGEPRARKPITVRVPRPLISSLFRGVS